MHQLTEKRREEIENREEEYTYTYNSSIRIPSFYRKKNRCRKITLYIPQNKMSLLDEVKKIFIRESISKREASLSHFFVEKMEQYYQLHQLGNPQQRIDIIMKLGKAYHAPNPICGFKDCLRDVVTVAVFQKTKETYGLCAVHKKEAQDLGPKVWRFIKQC